VCGGSPESGAMSHAQDVRNLVVGLRLLALAIGAFVVVPVVTLVAGGGIKAEWLAAMRAGTTALQVVSGVLMVVAVGAWLIGVRLVFGAITRLRMNRALAWVLIAVALQIVALGAFIVVRKELDPDLRKTFPLAVCFGGAVVVMASLTLACTPKAAWPGLGRPGPHALGLGVGTLGALPLCLGALRVIELPLFFAAICGAVTLATALPVIVKLSFALATSPPAAADTEIV